MVNTAAYRYGSDTGSASATFAPAVQPLYLPVVFKNAVWMPGLVIDDLRVNGDNVEVVIRNVGTTSARDDFWVDVYFNPAYRPPRINQRWPLIAEHGIIWGVTVDTANLDPGESLTLVNDGTDPYYWGPPNSSALPLPVGQDVYVDSVNWATTWGAVRESNEGNNTAGPE